MKCMNCKSRTHRRQVKHSALVSGVELQGTLPADVCSQCEASTMDLAELARFELRAAAALVAHGVCTGEAFRFMRKTLGMRAADVGEVLGVAAETVSRWETGQREMDRHAFAMLGELVIAAAENRPSPADRFKALASTDRKLPRAIDLAS